MKCNSCGANLPENQSTCEYCGSRSLSTEPSHDADIFRQIKASPKFVNRLSEERIAKIPKPGIGGMIFLGVFFTMFCGIALFMSFMFIGVGGALSFSGDAFPFSLMPICMGVVPLGMFALGIFLAVTQFKRFHQMTDGDVDAIPAIVTGKRTAISGGNNRSTSYHVTFEFEDGERKEFPVFDGSFYGRLSEEDAGILFLRGEFAADFDRVRI